MKTVFQILKKHYIAIAFLLIYTLLCLRTLQITIDFHERLRTHPGISGIAAGGEGIGLVDFFLMWFAGIFFFINFGLAFYKQKEMKFYLWLCALIVAEGYAILNLG